MIKLIEDWLFDKCYDLALDYGAKRCGGAGEGDIDDGPQVEDGYNEFKLDRNDIDISFIKFKEIYDQNKYFLQEIFIEEWSNNH